MSLMTVVVMVESPTSSISSWKISVVKKSESDPVNMTRPIVRRSTSYKFLETRFCSAKH
jgi:hypothetical protein